MEEIVYTDLLALVEQDGFQSVRESTSCGGQYNGPCPWCQGDDRFRIQPHYGRYGRYACSICGRMGDAIDYLIQKRGLTRQDALLTVRWTPPDGSEPLFLIPASALDERPTWDAPPDRWQDATRDFCLQCQETLWSKGGRAALDYLYQRGFTEKTIKGAGLGYNPKERYSSAHVVAVKGKPKPVRLWQGIVIPWFYQREIWRVTIRDDRVASGPRRYKQLAGGSNGLYLADSLRLKRPTVVVTEGEFDALSVVQSCGDRVAVVATGTTSGGHTPRWIDLLVRQKRVLIAFDGEEKGDQAAKWWLERLKNAQRLRPWIKDANAMLQQGRDLHCWIETSGVPFAVPIENASRTPIRPSDPTGTVERVTGRVVQPQKPRCIWQHDNPERDSPEFPFSKDWHYYRTPTGIVGHRYGCDIMSLTDDKRIGDYFACKQQYLTWEEAREWWFSQQVP